jgi:hypothetical protein
MKITFDSELMENHKHATVLAPDNAFEVLQTDDGATLFFSISDSHNKFYLTREVTKTSTGWNRIELNKTIPESAGKPRTFAVAQNAKTLAIDLALVMTADGADTLYVSLDNANTAAAWEKGILWTPIPFDATPAPSPLSIADVLLLNIPDQGQVIVADVERKSGDPLHLLDRYYIVPGSSPRWNPHKIGAALAAGSISSCLGKNTSDPLPGVYTFGTIAGERELIFTPQYNYFDPHTPPSDTRLKLPAGASAIASALNSSGLSNLFVGAADGLYLFTPDNQHDESKGGTAVRIASSSVTAGATQLAAATAGGRTAVWGVDAQGQLFHIACRQGHEADPAAWSTPVPLLKAEAFAFFLNLNAGNNVLFAQLDGQHLVQLTQDPVTTAWQQRSILLPTAAVDDLITYKSFTTHINVTDDYNTGAPNTDVAITATSPISVYLNDVYHRLSPSVAVNTTTDPTGVLTVVQETDSLSAVCFRVEVVKTPEIAAEIDPTKNAVTRLGELKDGELADKKITNADGTQQYLVPRDQAGNCPAAENAFAQLVKVHKLLPPDGSLQRSKLTATAASVPWIWGVSFTGGRATYHEGEAAVAHFGLHERRSGFSIALESGKLVSAGDFWSWLKGIWEKVEQFFVTLVEGVYHFVVKIADEFYHALLECIDAVVHAVEFVFNKIKVFIEELIKWLGFILQWSDILRAHEVLKNILLRYAEHAVTRLGQIDTDIDDLFNGLEAKIDAWAGIKGPGDTIGSYQARPPAKGQNSPGSHWALHHFKSNLDSTTKKSLRGSASHILSDKALRDANSIIDDIKILISSVEKDFADAIKEFKTDLVDKFETLSATDIIKRLADIATKLLLNIAKDLIKMVVKLCQAVISGLTELLTEPLDIPVLSPIYKLITKGDTLTALDVACLIAAIPTTIVYKLAVEKAPFPDNDLTKQLIHAPDLAAIQKIFARRRDAAQEADDDFSVVYFFGDACAFIGSIAVAYLNFKKYNVVEVSPGMALASIACSLPYIGNDIVQACGPQHSDILVGVNDFVTVVWFCKTVVDNVLGATAKGLVWSNEVSPFAEALINTMWLFPDCMFLIHNRKDSDWVGFGGNIAFDLGGIISPLASKTIMEELYPEGGALFAIGAFTVQEILTLAYGVLSIAAGGLILAGK